MNVINHIPNTEVPGGFSPSGEVLASERSGCDSSLPFSREEMSGAPLTAVNLHRKLFRSAPKTAGEPLRASQVTKLPLVISTKH